MRGSMRSVPTAQIKDSRALIAKDHDLDPCSPPFMDPKLPPSWSLVTGQCRTLRSSGESAKLNNTATPKNSVDTILRPDKHF